jgi:hypothetical protein
LAPQLLDEPRLADAWLAGDLEQLLLPHACSADREREHRELRLAALERKLGLWLFLADARRGADAVGRDRALLSLDEERLRCRVEPGAGAVEDGRGREDPAGLGTPDEPRGEIHGVAHNRVRPTCQRSDVTAKRGAAVHTRAEHERRVAVDDHAQRAQHPLFVGAGRRRRAADQVELSAVDVDVGLEPRQPEVARRRRDRARDPAQRAVDAVRALAVEQVVDAAELDECSRDVPVLRLARLQQQVRAERRRNVELEVALRGRGRCEVGDDIVDAGLVVDVAQQSSAFARGSEPRRLERFGRPIGDEDLAGVRRRLEANRCRRRRPGHDELAVRALDDEEVAAARVDPRRHPQRDRADGAHRPARLVDQPVHVGRRLAGSPLVAVAREENEQRVPAELEDVAAVAVGDADQARVDAREEQNELLRPGAALGLEPFREPREAGDVQRDERSLELLPRALGRLRPVHDQARQVWAEGRHRCSFRS